MTKTNNTEVVYLLRTQVVRRGFKKSVQVSITDGRDTWTFDDRATFTARELRQRFPYFERVTAMTKTNDELRDILFKTGAFDQLTHEQIVSLERFVFQDRKRLIDRFEAEAVGEDETCEKHHSHQKDWCSYCDYTWARNGMRLEQRQRLDTIKQEETHIVPGNNMDTDGGGE